MGAELAQPLRQMLIDGYTADAHVGGYFVVFLLLKKPQLDDVLGLFGEARVHEVEYLVERGLFVAAGLGIAA